tara:strand:- start:8 stop:517 length:510 start_codon:yes stop_codon:yes gene_type:complete
MNETQIEYCYECLNPANNMTPHKKGYRVCTYCKGEKKYSEFHLSKNHAHGVVYICKECANKRNKEYYDPVKNRVYEYKSKFGITLDDYNRMLKSQNNRCAICNSTATGNRSQKYLSIDHCHATGKVRGLLCHGCNSGIGHLKDDIELLKKAITYLGKHGIILKEKGNDH